MRIIICGSRSINGPQGVEAVRRAMKNSGWDITEIISGEADGVDKIAIELAKELNIDLVIMPANWKKYNKAAGYKRNQKMAWYAALLNDKEDDRFKGGCIAVWNGNSSGTKHMIDLARKASLPVFVSIVEQAETEAGPTVTTVSEAHLK